MINSDSPLYRDPDYIQGQLAATHALVLGLANMLLTKEAFREESLKRLDILKTSHLSQPVNDARLQAIDDCEAWIKTVTT
jgi:hypothetical protein